MNQSARQPIDLLEDKVKESVAISSQHFLTIQKFLHAVNKNINALIDEKGRYENYAKLVNNEIEVLKSQRSQNGLLLEEKVAELTLLNAKIDELGYELGVNSFKRQSLEKVLPVFQTEMENGNQIADSDIETYLKAVNQSTDDHIQGENVRKRKIDDKVTQAQIAYAEIIRKKNEHTSVAAATAAAPAAPVEKPFSAAAATAAATAAAASAAAAAAADVEEQNLESSIEADINPLGSNSQAQPGANVVEISLRMLTDITNHLTVPTFNKSINISSNTASDSRSKAFANGAAKLKEEIKAIGARLRRIRDRSSTTTRSNNPIPLLSTLIDNMTSSDSTSNGQKLLEVLRENNSSLSTDISVLFDFMKTNKDELNEIDKHFRGVTGGRRSSHSPLSRRKHSLGRRRGGQPKRKTQRRPSGKRRTHCTGRPPQRHLGKGRPSKRRPHRRSSRRPPQRSSRRP
jgi:hypothetical protein